MAEEIVFFAAKCHKSHLKAQKEAALFLRNLLELICAGVTCEKQSHPLPRPHPTPLSLFPSWSRPDRPPPALRMMMKVMGAPQSEVPERGVRPWLFNRDGYFWEGHRFFPSRWVIDSTRSSYCTKHFQKWFMLMACLGGLMLNRSYN